MSCTGTRTATQAMTAFEYRLSTDHRGVHRAGVVHRVAHGLTLLAEH
ncbi:hypothetical protein [Stutzerimonas stutzeri]|nr:hypothetical protein [Stutzerimonas stutzeri]MCQ4259593.1 hypothetical protein [Stutzerimonas stutzeri]